MNINDGLNFTCFEFFLFLFFSFEEHRVTSVHLELNHLALQERNNKLYICILALYLYII